MKTIKVYDADTLLRAEADMACHTFQKVAVFEGPHGVVVAEKEAVYDKLDSVDDSFRFHLTKIPEPGKMYLVPTAYVDIPVSFILENAPCEEMDFYSFFSRRNYNPRCQNNFRYLCGHLREIGFEIPKEPLAQKVESAAARTPSSLTDTRITPAPARA